MASPVVWLATQCIRITPATVDTRRPGSESRPLVPPIVRVIEDSHWWDILGETVVFAYRARDFRVPTVHRRYPRHLCISGDTGAWQTDPRRRTFISIEGTRNFQRAVGPPGRRPTFHYT